MTLVQKHKTIAITWFTVILAILAISLFLFSKELSNVGKEKPVLKTDQFDPLSYKDISYEIDTKPIKLAKGSFQGLGPDEPVSVEIFGNEAYGDLNNDGLSDVAFILVEDTGGTGFFYYVAVALRGKDGYVGTNAVFIGDRISPQTTEIKNGQLVVNYADRLPSEPFTATPSVGMSKYLKISGEKLVDQSTN